MTTKPILLTGSPRSGTTWIGKMLAESSDLLYIQEPFNPNIKYRKGRCGAIFDHWFTYISSDNEKKYFDSIKNTLNLSYNLPGVLGEIHDFQSFRVYGGEFRDFLISNLQNRKPLIKDPIAVFAAEWMASKFDINVVILIRNPFAFVGSMKKANWTFDFNNFLQQPLLLNKYLSIYADQIKYFAQNKPDTIDSSILLWRCIYYTVYQYQQKYPNWIFIKHEDFSKNVVDNFTTLFNQLNVTLTDKLKAKILKSSNVETKPDHLISSQEIQRNSLDNLKSYQYRLTKEEIDLIQRETEDVTTYFYSSDD